MQCFSSVGATTVVTPQVPRRILLSVYDRNTTARVVSSNFAAVRARQNVLVWTLAVHKIPGHEQSRRSRRYDCGRATVFKLFRLQLEPDLGVKLIGMLLSVLWL